MSTKDFNSSQCPVCKGTGYELKKPIKCTCSNICYKCENKGGLLVQIYDTCKNCNGSGSKS